MEPAARVVEAIAARFMRAVGASELVEAARYKRRKKVSPRSFHGHVGHAAGAIEASQAAMAAGFALQGSCSALGNASRQRLFGGACGIFTHLGDVDGAISKPIEEARRAQRRPCQHNWQAVAKPQGEPQSKSEGDGLDLGFQKGSAGEVDRENPSFRNGPTLIGQSHVRMGCCSERWGAKAGTPSYFGGTSNTC